MVTRLNICEKITIVTSRGPSSGTTSKKSTEKCFRNLCFHRKKLSRKSQEDANKDSVCRELQQPAATRVVPSFKFSDTCWSDPSHISSSLSLDRSGVTHLTTHAVCHVMKPLPLRFIVKPTQFWRCGEMLLFLVRLGLDQTVPSTVHWLATQLLKQTFPQQLGRVFSPVEVETAGTQISPHCGNAASLSVYLWRIG